MSEPIPPVTSTALPGADEAGTSHEENTEPPVGAADLPADAVGLELVKLLAESQSADFASNHAVGASDGSLYDGHVALTLDPGALPDIDSTLDLLTSSHQLFDVPALDVASVLDDSLPT